jgi:hypothetical protein
MKLGIWLTLILLGQGPSIWAQATGHADSAVAKEVVSEPPASNYSVFGATPEQEAILRSQIRIMHPEIEPLRVFFLPHWKYLDAARAFQLHVPTGFGSLMFTHLASRTVYIDNDRYMGTDWLGHWIAHELGHLASHSTKEHDAEKVAREYRKRLKDARKANALCDCGRITSNSDLTVAALL